MNHRLLFGAAVRKRRKNLGFSQEELAARAELDRTYVSGIERGLRNPSLINIYKLAVALDSTPEDIFSIANEIAKHSTEENN